jgi:hypothetical protein
MSVVSGQKYGARNFPQEWVWTVNLSFSIYTTQEAVRNIVIPGFLHRIVSRL